MRIRLALLALALLTFLAFGTEVQAETGVRYPTFTMSNDRLVRTQTAYIPITATDNIHGVALKTPNDIHIDRENNIYIVSTGDDGGKLVTFNLEEEDVRVFGEDYLVNPTGVHVNDHGDMFIADRDGAVVYRLNSEGDILMEYTRPDSPLFGAESYRPRKVVADNRGNVYVLNRGTRGLAQFGPQGEFLGYFGTNTITPTLRTVLQQTFFTREQRERLFALTPPEISNMTIDGRGLIHTVSLGVEERGVKRLNISGENLLPAMHNPSDLADVFVGPIGNIYVITRSGMIYEYDREGNLLFAFGGQDVSNQISGLHNVPSGIAVDSDFNIFTVDRASGELQVFAPTEFANLVHLALSTYQEGHYLESMEPWQEVLRMNDFFDLAHQGIGNAAYSLGEYEEALESYRMAHDRDGYSEAFWEVRNEWLMDYAGGFFVGLFVFLFVYVVNLKLRFMKTVKKPLKDGFRFLRKKSSIFDEMMFLFSFLRHPPDSTYAIKREERVGYVPATILLILYFVFYVFYIYNLNFLFNHRILTEINMIEETAKVLLPIVIWVFANYLIGSIREGEGRFKDVYVASIFALAPLFLTLPLLTVFSWGLTYNEAFLVDFIMSLAVMVTALYFFFMVKEVHFYSVKETVQSIFISAFTMALLVLGTFIVYILLNELVTLIRDIFMEVFYRV